jgi:HK97 family phage portal protein
MSAFARLLGGSERKAVDVTALTWQGLLGAPLSKTGVNVNIDKALCNSTVLGCVRVMAETVAQLPLKIMLERKSGTKEVASEHPAHAVVAYKPNAWQSPFEWRETAMYHAMLGRGAFSLINRVGGQVDELIPLSPGSVAVKYARGDISLEVRDDKGIVGEFPRGAVTRVSGPSWNSVQALQMLKLAAEAIGLSAAIEESQARLHANGARPGGTLSTPNTLTEEARKRLEAIFVTGFAGVVNSGKVPILDNGLKFESAAMTGVDAQTLESRKYQVFEIARMLRVHPQMLFESDKTATYASAAQFAQDFVKFCLMPWLVRWEQALTRDLLSPEDARAGYFAHFVVEGLLRGDEAARSTYFKAALGTASSPGWMSPNDVRRLEDLDPDERPEASRIVTVADLSQKAVNPANTDGGAEPIDPAAAPAVTDGGAAVQDTALNGAQVASLLEIIQSVADGKLPLATARAMIRASFPAVSDTTVDDMLKGLDGSTPAAPAAAAHPPAADPKPPA